VLFIVLDDTGYGQFGCYGAPIRTPNLDALAAGGLRYANFHTTALCSPTRSCLITGRNHHSNGMACITEAPQVIPAARDDPLENGFLSEILLQNGYSTYAVGKWHLTQGTKCQQPGLMIVGRWDAVSALLWFSRRRYTSVLPGIGLR